MKQIPLTQGFVALIDDSDYGTVSQFKWFAVKNRRGVYAARTLPREGGNSPRLYLHQFLFPALKRVDHLDGDGLNNQRGNLRAATTQQNSRGARKKPVGKSSRFRGVDWNKKNQKWRAYIGVDWKKIYLGLFQTEEDAARAFDRAALAYFGEFAALNFPT